jgi:hypothetical protein
VTVEATDAGAIEEALLDSYAAHKSGRDILAAQSDLSSYERRHGARQLAKLLSELASGNPLAAASDKEARMVL